MPPVAVGQRGGGGGSQGEEGHKGGGGAGATAVSLFGTAEVVDNRVELNWLVVYDRPLARAF